MYSQQDELSRLFAQNLSFTQPLPQIPSTPDKQFLGHQQQPIYYTSSHYTPTNYLHLQNAGEQAPQQEQQQQRADSPLAVSQEEYLVSTLRQHDIDPSSLSPSQVKLFTNADYEQRLRLLELWRISPPQGNDVWQYETNMAQEEQSARLRYEEQMRARERQQQQQDSASIEVEPYMTSGYANKRHSEPVYASCSGGLWSAQNTRSAQQMQDDGALEQARSFERLQSLNAQIESRRFGADDDMIM